MSMSDRATISVIHEADTTEVQWSDREPGDGVIFGYLLLHSDGTLTVPFRNADDDAFVFVLDSDGGRVVSSEDQPPVASAPVLWSSEKVV